MGDWQNALQSIPSTRKLDQHCSFEEVLEAVETLYADELKPFSRILRKRLAERAIVKGYTDVDVDITGIRAVCESCPLLRVHPEGGNDWSTTLEGRTVCFIDVYSPHDDYPPELWQEATAYFDSLDESDMVLPGGRYLCANALMRRKLPFLEGRSLGQVSHIVQLAISQKKLLGYLHGAVVPYRRSQSMLKERCAERLRPCISTRRSTKALATWGTVRTHLYEILDGLDAGADAIPLSNVKRLFRSKFRIELSETALGYSKLSDLLQDPRLSDVCNVWLQGHGYVVSPKLQLQLSNSINLDHDRNVPCTGAGSEGEGKLEQELELAEINSLHLASPGTAVCSKETLSSLEFESADYSGCIVHNTFIHAMPTLGTQSAGSTRRSKSLPHDWISDDHLNDGVYTKLDLLPQPRLGRIDTSNDRNNVIVTGLRAAEGERLLQNSCTDSSKSTCTFSSCAHYQSPMAQDEGACYGGVGPYPALHEFDAGTLQSEIAMDCKMPAPFGSSSWSATASPFCPQDNREPETLPFTSSGPQRVVRLAELIALPAKPSPRDTECDEAHHSGRVARQRGRKGGKASPGTRNVHIAGGQPLSTADMDGESNNVRTRRARPKQTRNKVVQADA